MAKDYVEERGGGCYVLGSRVSLDSIVYAYLRGDSPEGIAESFPGLSAEQVFGALAFYLANRPIIDRHLQEERAEFSRVREEARRRRPTFYAKLEASRDGGRFQEGARLGLGIGSTHN